MNHPYRAKPAGFTLVELLVVIGIIGVLISILVPVVSKIRRSAQNTDTQSQISQLSNAIQNYYNDFRAYPGPMTNYEVSNSQFITMTIKSDASTANFITAQPNFSTKITMAENLVLGLLGGLRRDSVTGKIEYLPSLVGSGPVSLNQLTPKRSEPYTAAVNLSWRDENGKKTGQFKDDVGGADDSIIPEFVDKYASPLPILYLRARSGVAVTGTPQDDNNTVITYDQGDNARNGQYDLHQILPYTGEKIGAGRTQPSYKPDPYPGTKPFHGLSTVNVGAKTVASAPNDPKYFYPYDAYPYFRNQALSTPAQTDPNYPSAQRNDVPQQKDAYILISAGPDRVYGTDDDVTNFGTVGK